MAEWVTAKELFEWVKEQKPLTLLDVRMGQVGGFIPGSRHIPVLDLEDEPQGWDPETSVVVYCQFGKGASDYAAEVLEQQGVAGVYKLQGGFDAWLKFLASREQDESGV
ncbi:hypothetical protein TPY_0798 [Sulfobacillus acidophilus TPY]|uniref:Rhodanese-like protein n=1 Tax=Sulfobacillus acidophilus (strain ATCC 700253 / DSM 10332 / NAL) TaxID=679936 RepID=G8TZ33_SULAD|nr:hypothetical protein TPY_0798 [Sulfobacillus acidophilus TPY]AEW06303.1 Rhodanese-like protein [Sulfobacillus acidophilus DSM 10332]